MKDSLFSVGGIAPSKTSPVQKTHTQPSNARGKSQFGKILNSETQAQQAQTCKPSKQEEPQSVQPDQKTTPDAVPQAKDVAQAAPVIAAPVTAAPVTAAPVTAAPAIANPNQANNQSNACQDNGEQAAAEGQPKTGAVEPEAVAPLAEPTDLAPAVDPDEAAAVIEPAQSSADEASPDKAGKLDFQAQLEQSLGDGIEKLDLAGLNDNSVDPAVVQKLASSSKPPVTSAANTGSSPDLSFGAQSKSGGESKAAADNPDVSNSVKNSDAKTAAPKPESPPLVSSGLEKNSTAEGSKGIESARLAEARTSEVMKQVLQGLEMVIKNKNVTMRMQLYPDNLGHIELKVVSGQNGLNVFLKADQPSTQQLLESQAAFLKQSLSSAGVNASQIDFGQGNKNRASQSRDAWQPARSSLQNFKQEDLSNQPGLDIPVLGMNISRSGVDYKV